MWKSWSSLAVLLAAGCLSPGMTEGSSIGRVEAAADEIGKALLMADRSAQTNVDIAYRFFVVPASRSFWVAERFPAGAWKTQGSTFGELEAALAIHQCEGMAPQADGSYLLEFPLGRGLPHPVRIHLSEQGGVRRILAWRPGEKMPVVYDPAEAE